MGSPGSVSRQRHRGVSPRCHRRERRGHEFEDPVDGRTPAAGGDPGLVARAARGWLPRRARSHRRRAHPRRGLRPGFRVGALPGPRARGGRGGLLERRGRHRRVTLRARRAARGPDGRARAWPSCPQSFDGACSSHLIEHFTDPEPHVAELARVVKDDGLVCVLTPNKPADFENPFHLHLFDRAELRAHARATFRRRLARRRRRRAPRESRLRGAPRQGGQAAPLSTCSTCATACPTSGTSGRTRTCSRWPTSWWRATTRGASPASPPTTGSSPRTPTTRRSSCWPWPASLSGTEPPSRAHGAQPCSQSA